MAALKEVLRRLVLRILELKNFRFLELKNFRILEFKNLGIFTCVCLLSI